MLFILFCSLLFHLTIYPEKSLNISSCKSFLIVLYNHTVLYCVVLTLFIQKLFCIWVCRLFLIVCSLQCITFRIFKGIPRSNIARPKDEHVHSFIQYYQIPLISLCHVTFPPAIQLCCAQVGDNLFFPPGYFWGILGTLDLCDTYYLSYHLLNILRIFFFFFSYMLVNYFLKNYSIFSQLSMTAPISLRPSSRKDSISIFQKSKFMHTLNKHFSQIRNERMLKLHV